jgi:hypothetical protein
MIYRRMKGSAGRSDPVGHEKVPYVAFDPHYMAIGRRKLRELGARAELGESGTS